ncbi:MAG: hypothetical protein HYV08_11780 [Deltaproteobacteria bacterium]|nr:hypothetical protein [Deltaproteobacteria bacterium]MBI3076016.1 hypothetical protein [Deltaproteobacteria bacterium]
MAKHGPRVKRDSLVEGDTLIVQELEDAEAVATGTSLAGQVRRDAASGRSGAY